PTSARKATKNSSGAISAGEPPGLPPSPASRAPSVFPSKPSKAPTNDPSPSSSGPHIVGSCCVSLLIVLFLCLFQFGFFDLRSLGRYVLREKLVRHFRPRELAAATGRAVRIDPIALGPPHQDA